VTFPGKLYDTARIGSTVYDPFGKPHDIDYFLVLESEIETIHPSFKVQMKRPDGFLVLRTNRKEQIDYCITSLRLIEEFLENPENISLQARNAINSRIIYGIPSFEKSRLYKTFKKYLSKNFLEVSQIFFKQYLDDQGLTDFSKLFRLGKKEATKRFLRATYVIKTWNLPPPLFKEVNNIYHTLRRRKSDGVSMKELYEHWDKIRNVLSTLNSLLFSENNL